MNNFDPHTFLRDFWQQKPLVIRAAFADPHWIDPDELAGLACEDGIEARIISQQDSRWQVENGPFSESRFSALPERDWTLLVQAVDQWDSHVCSILDYFRFLPSWRLDDIMVSYAPTGGTVSQHYDYFDVFLIQGEGTRKWQVGQICGPDSPLLDNTAVKILRDFDPQLETILEPGDVLYVPAKHAHYGVSLDDSLTYSVGFRAPSIRDLVDGVATELLTQLADDARYRDTRDSLTAPTGEIPKAAIDQLQAMIRESLSSAELIQSWFGQYVTERKYPDLDLYPPEPEGWRERVMQGEPIFKNPSSRFAYSADVLFVDGHSFSCASEFARYLCNSAADTALDMHRYLTEECLQSLVANGSLIFNRT